MRKSIDTLYLAEVVDIDPAWESPFMNGETVLVLGEIKHMPGHVAVVKDGGVVQFAYHVENFRMISPEEV